MKWGKWLKRLMYATLAFFIGWYACPLFEESNANKNFRWGVKYLEKENYVEAEKCFRIAAKNGIPEAYYNIGMMYYNGMGMKKDYREAEHWLLSAAEKGFVDAQFCLGMVYMGEKEGDQNPKEALRWFLVAAVNKQATAAYNVGVLYKHGFGVERDTVLARMWYDRAEALKKDIADSK